MESSGPSKRPKLLVLSAKSAPALDDTGDKLAAYLGGYTDTELADAAYTLQVGRKRYPHRRMLVCDSAKDAISALENGDPKRVVSHVDEGTPRQVAFMFPGQGTQYLNMCAELYRTEDVFRASFDRCAELLKKHLELDLRDIVFCEGQNCEDAEDRLNQTRFTQPALFAVEFALADLWMKWGVKPQALIGHSIGEYVAACIAGVFSLEDAVSLVVLRAQMMQSLPAGAMLAVVSSAEALEPMLTAQLSVASINAPELCVVAGPVEAVDNLEQRLAEGGMTSRRLSTSHAFHSHMMEPIVDSFMELVAQINLNPPQIPFISNLTGSWITEQEATDPVYWARHLRHPVLLSDGISELVRSDNYMLLEVGPGNTLATLARQHLGARESETILSSLGHRHSNRPEQNLLLEALGKLWLFGATVVDWSEFYKDESRRRVQMPTYPFQRKRYWVERLPDSPSSSSGRNVRKRADIATWFYLPSWKRTLLTMNWPDERITAERCNWLLFEDEFCGVGRRIGEFLRQQGQVVTVVRAGEKFQKHDAHTFTIEPGCAEHYGQLISELREVRSFPRRVLHLWTIQPIANVSDKYELAEREIGLGFYSLLFLFQALGKESTPNQIDVCVFSTNLHQVYSEDLVRPERAMIQGPCMVAPQEYPHIHCRIIDVGISRGAKEIEESVIERLVAEAVTSRREHVVAYRGHNRWTQHYESIELPDAPPKPLCLKEQGVYVILGGTGRFGSIVADHIIKSVRAKLILIGSSEFPERSEWAQWLTKKDQNDPTTSKIKRIQELERNGAEVLVLTADLGNVSAVDAAFDKIHETFGRINGVFHAAGLVGEQAHQPLQDVTKAVCEPMFQPKLYGLINLYNVLRDKDIDFCLITSSLSSVLGGLGFVAYSSANLFLDAFSGFVASSEGSPWRTVNWERWHRQKGVGLVNGFGEELAELVMTDEEVSTCLSRVFDYRELQQVVIATGDLNERIKQWIDIDTVHDEMLKEQEQVRTNLHSRPQLSTDFVAPRDEIEARIAELIESTLGIGEVGINDNFFELGGTSLAAVQLIARLRALFQQDFPLRELFETPTVARLAEVVSGNNEQPEAHDEIELILAEIEQLTDDEARAELERELEPTER